MILRRFFSHSVQNFQKLLPVSSNKLISLESSPRNLRNFTTMKEETTKFFVPPPREPYNEKDDPNETNTYVDFTKDLYYKFIGN